MQGAPTTDPRDTDGFRVSTVPSIADQIAAADYPLYLDPASVFSFTGYVGETVTFGDDLDPANQASYNASWVCRNAANDAVLTIPVARGSFTLPEAIGELVGTSPTLQCIATNVRGGATVLLQKAWTASVTGDQTELWVKDFEYLPEQNPDFGTLDNPDLRVKTSTANGQVTTWIDNQPADTVLNNVTEAQSLTASKVYLSETLSDDNQGDYLAGAPTCVATDQAGATVTVAAPVRATQADADAVDRGVVGANDYVLTVPNVPGVTVVCTVENRMPRGTITIVKAVEGADGTFDFAADWPGIDPEFSLTTVNGTASVTTVQVPIGQYTIAETDAGAQHDLTELVCVDSVAPGDGGTDSVVADLEGTINLDDGETVTCTLTNTQKTTLVVTKDAQPNHAQPFDFTVTSADATVPAGLASFSLVDNGATPATNTITGLLPNSGTYVVTETETPGWTLDADPDLTFCVGADADGTWQAEVDATGAITTGRANPGGTISCTFVNKVVPAELTIEKSAVDVPDDYAWQFQFTLSPTELGTTTQTVSGTGAEPGSTTFTGLEIGKTYTLAEVPLTGWEQTAFSCIDATTQDELTDLDADRAGWQFVATPAQQITCTVENTMLPNSLELVKTAHLDDVNGDGLGNLNETIHWEFAVTNTSPVPLHSISIDDPTLTALGLLVTCPMLDTAELGVLAPAETTVCKSSTYTITAADVTAGSIKNVATAKGTAPEPPGGGTPPEVVSPPDDTDTPTGPLRTLTLSRTATGVPDDYAWEFTFVLIPAATPDVPAPAAVSKTVSAVGPTQSGQASFDIAFGASYSLHEVTRSGWELTSLVCTDQSGALTDQDATAVGLQFTVKAAQQISCAAVNVMQPGSLDLVKTARLDDKNGDGKGNLGEQISWTFKVTNTSAVEVSGIQIVDPKLAELGVSITCPTPATLAPGASLVCESGAYTITQADVTAGRVHNVATATVKTPGGDVESPPDETDTPTVSLVASLTIVKTAILTDTNGNKLGDVGEKIRYEFLVTNTGAVRITSIAVDDSLLKTAGIAVNCPVTELAPGAATTCTSTGSYTVTAADVVAGKVTNTATATGRTPGGERVDSPPSTVSIKTGRPALPKTGGSEIGLAGVGVGLMVLVGFVAGRRRRG